MIQIQIQWKRKITPGLVKNKRVLSYLNNDVRMLVESRHSSEAALQKSSLLGTGVCLFAHWIVLFVYLFFFFFAQTRTKSEHQSINNCHPILYFSSTKTEFFEVLSSARQPRALLDIELDVTKYDFENKKWSRHEIVTWRLFWRLKMKKERELFEQIAGERQNSSNGFRFYFNWKIVGRRKLGPVFALTFFQLSLRRAAMRCHRVRTLCSGRVSESACVGAYVSLCVRERAREGWCAQ